MSEYTTFFNGDIQQHANANAIINMPINTLIYIHKWPAETTPWRVKTKGSYAKVSVEDVPPEIRTQLLLIS